LTWQWRSRPLALTLPHFDAAAAVATSRTVCAHLDAVAAVEASGTRFSQLDAAAEAVAASRILTQWEVTRVGEVAPHELPSNALDLALEIRQFWVFLESHERECLLARGDRAEARANDANKLSCSPGA
jgi:hypothetical protein